MEEHFETHISAEHSLLELHIRETLRYRDLIVLFVKRSFTTQYKQTILGPLWAIIQPLMTTVVFTIIFGNLAKLTTADISGDFPDSSIPFLYGRQYLLGVFFIHPENSIQYIS